MADFTVDYNDERFNKVETEKNNAITETKNTYDQMINNSDSHYQDLINASKDYANKQTELQNAQTNLTVDSTIIKSTLMWTIQARTKVIEKIYHYTRLTDWSAWQDEKVEPSNNRRVETKTVYRYRKI